MHADLGLEIVELLRRICLQLDQLPKEIAAEQLRGASLTAEDRRAIGQLLPEIDALIKDDTFTAKSLVEDAREDHKLARALALALGESFTPRQLGKLLSRARDLNCSGLQVVCSAKARDGLLWRVERV